MAESKRLGSRPLDWIKTLPESTEISPSKLTDIQHTDPHTLKLNELNRYFQEESQEYFDDLTADIRERGIIVPLIAKKDGTLLAGHNRLKVALTLSLKTVPVQYVKEQLSNEQERQYLFKDNLLRRQLSAKDKEELIKQMYTSEISKDRRGGDRKNKIKTSGEVLIPLPERIEAETGIKAGTAMRILAKIRKRESEKTVAPSSQMAAQQHIKAIEKIVRNADDTSRKEIRKQLQQLISLL